MLNANVSFIPHALQLSIFAPRIHSCCIYPSVLTNRPGAVTFLSAVIELSRCVGFRHAERLGLTRRSHTARCTGRGPAGPANGGLTGTGRGRPQPQGDEAWARCPWSNPGVAREANRRGIVRFVAEAFVAKMKNLRYHRNEGGDSSACFIMTLPQSLVVVRDQNRETVLSTCNPL